MPYTDKEKKLIWQRRYRKTPTYKRIQRTYMKKYWQKYKETYKDRRYKNIIRIKEEYGGKCAICGYDKNYAYLIFHHTNDDTKEMEVARYYSYHKMKKEALGCVLLCQNCHLDLHNPNRRK